MTRFLFHGSLHFIGRFGFICTSAPIIRASHMRTFPVLWRRRHKINDDSRATCKEWPYIGVARVRPAARTGLGPFSKFSRPKGFIIPAALIAIIWGGIAFAKPTYIQLSEIVRILDKSV